MAAFFSGRYYKHQKDGHTVCLIVGQAGKREFVQVITNKRTWQYDTRSGCRADDDGLTVELPGIQGAVRHGPLSPLCGDVMGPFRFLPMQCRHEVVSMHHSLSGGFVIDGEVLNLTGGMGYIEGDRGRSFPREYLWLHSNDFPKPCSILASVADIPFCAGRFLGCICAVCWGGRQYRLATYHGVKILAADRHRLVLAQGSLRLEVEIDASNAHPLRAPKNGKMTQTIHESNCARAQFRFWAQGKQLFDLLSENCSFECNLHAETAGL